MWPSKSLSSEGIEIDTFEIAQFALGTGKDRRRVDKPHESWKKGQRFEAIIVEQSSPSRSYDKLVRWLGKAVPETAILAYASPPLAEPLDERANAALLSSTPTPKSGTRFSRFRAKGSR